MKEMEIGGRKFVFGKKTYLMGILNVTPDSFSDGGNFWKKDAALFHAENMILEGADILDIGAESTRPGYQMISEEEEIERLLPVIRAIKERFEIPISVDTYKAKVAYEAAKEGADMINDIWGFRFDRIEQEKKAVSKMAEIAAKTGLVVCLMHNRQKVQYQDFSKEIMEDLKESLRIADLAGVKRERLILDPGVGFGKSYEQNLWCISHLEEFGRFGLPVLLGASKKSVIGQTLDLPVEERMEGTLVTTVMAVMKGAAFLRVHDIKENKRAVQMAERLLSI